MRAETMTQNASPSLLERRGMELVILILGVIIAVTHIWMNSFGNVSTLFQNGFHFAGFALLCALVTPVTTAPWAKNAAVRTLDIAFGIAVAAAALYVVLGESAVYDRGVRLIWTDWLAAGLCILGALEFTRRTTGLIIPCL
ncbi:MAG: hypothetical protein AAFX98_09665, partial [Pseudomonadota bacterium]